MSRGTVIATEARPDRSGPRAVRRGRALRSLVATAFCAGSLGAVAERSSAAPSIPTVSAPFNVQRLPIFYEGSDAEFAIRLSAASTDPVTVDFTVGGGDATPGRDYAATAGRLTFAPGETTHTVLLPLLDDDEAESETVGITLTNPVNATMGNPNSGARIFDNPSAYRLVASDGGVFSFGRPYLGSLGGRRLNHPVVGMASRSDGYWLVTADGGVFSFGALGFFGSLGGTTLARPIVGMAATSTGLGYWLVGSDGAVFAFGDAVHHGSTAGLALKRPIVGMAPTGLDRGYRLVASDGGVFTFGNASYHGSTGGMSLNAPIVGVAGSENGYWLAASDGGVFAFGDARFVGSMGGVRLNQPVRAIKSNDLGYWLVASDGGVFTFGGAKFRGSTGSLRLAQPIVAIS